MKNEIGNIVVIDDAPEYIDFIQRLLQPLLAKYSLATRPFTSAPPALDYIKRNPEDISVILTDYKMPEMDGLELINSIESLERDYQVIILSGNIDRKLSQNALHINIFDFLEKLTPPYRIADSVEKAYLFFVEKERRRASLKNLLKKFNTTGTTCGKRQKTWDKFELFNNMAGDSDSLKKISDQIKKVSESKAACLILGETGTGKELVARAIHNESTRRAKPFTAINCGAIPRDIFESELFGHRKGSFTGALSDRTGLIEKTCGGTLFLDEITEMPLDLQVKLLRFLEDSTIQRVGENISRRVNVRIVAASNREIKNAIREKAIREDLYYRINVVVFRTKPLRERKSEIKPLTDYFLDFFSALENKKRCICSGDVMDAFQQYYWPGNIRELRNVVHRMVLFSENGIITTGDLPNEILCYRNNSHEEINRQRRGFLKEQEKVAIRRVMTGEKTDVNSAARLLGISRATLYRRLKEYQIT